MKPFTSTCFALLAVVLFGAACTPTVKVETPDRPLEINMNVKIDHNIVVKVDKQLDKVMENNDEIF